MVLGLFGFINWGVQLKNFLFINHELYFIEERVAFILPLKFILMAKYCNNEQEKMSKMIDQHRRLTNRNLERKYIPKNNIENIVLVIGESLQRWHMSLYGYKRKTNPNLELYDKKNLLVFHDVISPHAQTHLSIPKILSLSHYENKSTNWYEQKNILSILHESGYLTYWISSHEPLDEASPTSFFASSADILDFSALYGKNGDAEIHNAIKKHIGKNKSKKFFIIHLAGSHYPYDIRYSKEFEYFSSESSFTSSLKDHYDNSVLFNDWVIDGIFQIFSKSDSIVIYISDHGEDVFDSSPIGKGHSDIQINRFMVEIPMLVYCSNLFIKKHRDIYQKLKTSIQNPYMSDDLIFTILDIVGLNTEFFDPKRSIIGDNFNKFRQRMVGGGGLNSGINYNELKGW